MYGPGQRSRSSLACCPPMRDEPHMKRFAPPSRTRSAGSIDGIATAPVNKLAFSRAGLPWKGHTDLLGNLTGAARRR